MVIRQMSRRLRLSFYQGEGTRHVKLLGADEMRITALGTGMPNQTKKAVSISYLVELGNGEKFLFDIGSGALGNLFSLRPDFSKIDKVFASHLHVDHVGDFMGLHVGSWLSGRYSPIHIYGPSGSIPELGINAFVEGMKKAYAWDIATRSGALPDAGGKIEVHEFNYLRENEIVYQENGVTIRSWPAIHSLDGSVSYSLEWNGLKYVFSGDTFPNKWYMKFAAGADVASHECFLPPKALASTSAGTWPRRPTFRRECTPSPRRLGRSCPHSSRAWRWATTRCSRRRTTRRSRMASARSTTARWPLRAT